SVPGLYAAGEAACVSVHGANRLGANSLLDTLVFGKRAGAHAAENGHAGDAIAETGEAAVRGSRETVAEIISRPGNTDRVASIRPALGKTMNPQVQVFRTDDGLRSALTEVQDLRRRYAEVGVENKGKVFNTDLLFHIELGFMLDCAVSTIVSAIERKESRG